MTKSTLTTFLCAVLAAAPFSCSGSNGDGIGSGDPPAGSSSGGASGSGSGGAGSSGAGTGSGSSSGAGSTGGSSSGSSGGGSSGADGSAPKGGADSGIGGTSGVTIIVEPNGNKASELVAAINGATKSVHMTMYLLDDKNVISALVSRAKAPGVDVKVILNDFSMQTSSGDNTTVLNQLKGDGVNVILSNPTEFNFTHEKCVIIDGATAWIMTMNTETSSPQYNREYLAIDTTAADVAEAESIFEADFANTQNFAASGGLVVAPQPPNNSRTALVDLIASATKTLDVEVEEFSDTYSTGITNAVAAAAKRGVKVRLVLANATPSATQTSSITTVKSAGASVVVSGGTSGSATAASPYIHAKAITVDCTGTTCVKGWVGSENMTGGSLGYNRELGVVITNATELAKVEAAINTDFAAGTAQ